MTSFEQFLGDLDVREIPWTKPSGSPAALTTDRVLIADGAGALEVALASATGRPKIDEVRRLWAARWGRRAAPVVLAVAYAIDGVYKASVCGTKDDPVVLNDLDLSQVERILAAALNAPDPLNAERTLHRLLAGQKDHLVAGLTNVGLFASHELRTGVPNRADWLTNLAGGKRLLRERGKSLLRGLGYTSTPHGSNTLILTSNNTNRAVAVLLDESEMFDRPTARFGTLSPVAQAIAIAQQQSIPWLVAIRGTQIRLYPAKPGIGVGRKGQAETFTELDLALLAEGDAAYLPLLFSSEALTTNGSVESILVASANHATALGMRLRDRVYVDVVPKLAVVVARQMDASSEAELAEAYHRTLTILFRLLFVSYAEDRGLLPYQRNPRYTKRALKTVAREFVDVPEFHIDSDAYDRWDDLLAIWRAVDDGNREWDVPAYNGGLFSSDRAHPTGRALAKMRLTNAEIGPVLRALLVDTDEDGNAGPVDFRSLTVREFGTIYEGLLESSLSVATTDLTVDQKTKAFLPATASGTVVVPAGDVYFHNASGARKATGSYFTKRFAVEHLLDESLLPALDAHLARVQEHLDAGDESRAADLFFDFRVIDLAMGSGHFLVAAIDRIESRFAAFLARSPLPAVTSELNRLSAAAHEAIGTKSPDIEIEPSALLRRQIARRCIYGIDLNRMAVELARLGIWIHTFVPGLPMSSLDHSLVVGNSLTGIGTVEEVLSILEPQRSPGQYSLFSVEIEEELRSAKDRLIRVARTTEATKREVREASHAHAKAMADAGDTKALMDLSVAVRLGQAVVVSDVKDAIALGRGTPTQETIEKLGAIHFPYLFPEVFSRPAGGFDVVLGNPPWDKVRWEAAPFWVGVFPGLMALKDKTRDAKIAELRASHPIEAAEESSQQELRGIQQALFKKSYSLRGGTHLELAQLMLERALKLLRPGGRIGLVLPRQSMVLAGWKNLRKQLVENYDLRIVQGRNRGQWIFDEIHASYAVALLNVGPPVRGATTVGVARTPEEITSMKDGTGVVFTPSDLRALSETHVIPWFNEPEDRRIFDIMRVMPRLQTGDGWVQGMHDARWDFRGSGGDNSLAVRTDSDGAWKVLMTAHVDMLAFDHQEPFKQFVDELTPVSFENRGVSQNDHRHFLADTHPVVVFRHPSRSDDSRTMIASALPEAGLLHNKGYIHAVKHASESTPDERLALLGLFTTLTLDWWVRRFVDRHITAPVVNQLPVPLWDPLQIARAAQLTGAALARNGATRLAGGIVVTNSVPDLSDLQIRVELEKLALTGYGLTLDDLALIATDFNETGLPENLRDALGIVVEADQP